MSDREPLLGEKASLGQASQQALESSRRTRNSKIASQVLESAIKGSDVRVLKDAIGWARKSDLPDDQIEKACLRQKMLESNQGPSLGEGGPRQTRPEAELGKLLQRAPIGGAAERAKRRRIEANKAELESREKEEAREALGLATTGTDLETLSSTLAWAESAGVEKQILEFARRRLAKLEIMSRLQQASISSSSDNLAHAISEAEAAGLEADVIDAARVRLRALELEAQREKAQDEHREAAEIALQHLLKTSTVDIAGVERALERAIYAGVSGDILVQARRSVLCQKEINRKEDIRHAREKLVDLCAGIDENDEYHTKNAIEIQNAIDYALRIDDNMLTREALNAQSRVDALKESKQLKLKHEATRALSSAIEWGGVEAIEAGLVRACQAGADEEIIAKARRQMSAMQDANLLDNAKTKLEDAIVGTSAEDLRSAVILSMRAGVSMEILWRAKRRMIELEKSSQSEFLSNAATTAIHDAVKKQCEKTLRLALRLGEELGVDEEVIRVAKMKLVQLL